MSKTDPDVGLRVVDLRAEGYKRLRAIHIRPDGSMIQITGENGAGKSSVLDAIAGAFDPSFIGAMPIRKGKTKAHISVDLGELRITRTFTAREEGGHSSTLVVENRDGSRPKSPQHVLDELAGIALDPVEFMRAKPKDRIDIIKRVVPDFDFAENAKKRKEAFDSRTLVNRQIAQATAARRQITLPSGPKPERVDVTQSIEDIRTAMAHNEIVRKRADRREQAETQIDNLLNEATILRAQVRELETKATALRKQLDEAEPLPDIIDVAAMQAKVGEATEIDSIVRRHEEAEGLDLAAVKYAAESEGLTKLIASFDEAKVAAITKAKLPGITLDDDMVMADGVPFDQASTAEQLRISTGIAMALKPRLKVILIRDGSLLDKASMQMLAEIAEENGFQVWLERVASGERTGILIEDGEVAA